MATLTFNGTRYECEVAIKGPDYVHLLDANGALILAFDGVVNFNAFSLQDASWTIAEVEDNCRVAVMREDGTIGAGSHRCRDIGTKGYTLELPNAQSSEWVLGKDGMYTLTYAVPGILSTDHVVVTAETNKSFIYNELIVTNANGALIFFTEQRPVSTSIIHLRVFSVHDNGSI